MTYHAGYSSIYLNRKANKSGGAICAFIRDHIEFKIRNDINGITTGKHNVEFLFIEILNHNSPNVIVGIIYRPPNSKYDEFEKALREILSKVDRENKPYYLMGDFNIDLLKYENCSFANRFFQLTSSVFLPLITKPTRLTEHTATNLN